MEYIKEGDRVLYLWEGEIDSSLEKNVDALKNRTNVTVNVENVQRLSLGMCEHSLFCSILNVSHCFQKRRVIRI